jgi:hypothetical protein
MKNTLIFLTLCFLAFNARAVEFNYAKNISSKDKSIIKNALDEVLKLTPKKFQDGLPKTISISLKAFRGPTSIPDVCSSSTDDSVRFKYGEFRFADKTLSINPIVLSELSKGPMQSKAISCQHKTLYHQAIATLLHELTHAYDNNNGRPSQDERFKDIAGFKNFFTKETQLNVNPMRSMDIYEYKSSEESFAVNMEYFTMDPEYACRRPVMFNYFKKHFNEDPQQGRACEVNYTVMLATEIGLQPYKIDPSRIFRIDYLLASDGEDIVSGFGHSMFRIIMCAPENTNSLTGNLVKATPLGRKCLEDKIFHIVPSFRANNEGATLNYMKGIFGGYPSMLFMLGLSSVIEEYNHSELRDLTSYPLKLSEAEKKDFAERLLEKHWDYSGSYKFATNNCAVESLTTLNGVLKDRKRMKMNRLNNKLTPKGVLKLLTEYNLVDEKDTDIETFKADIDPLISAYKLLYEDKYTKTVDQKNLKKFITESKASDRFQKFDDTDKVSFPLISKKENLLKMKEHYLKLAAFSYIEQQVFRTKTNELKKKMSEFTSSEENLKSNPELLQMYVDSKEKSLTPSSAASKGYGVPQEAEIKVAMDEQEITADAAKLFESAQRVLTSTFPNETKELNELAINLKIINNAGRFRRRQFRKLFEDYVADSIQSLSYEANGRAILTETLTGNTERFRESLGNELMTKTEISDERIKALIKQM